MNSMKHNNNKKGGNHNPAWSFSPQLSDSCDTARRLMYCGLGFSNHFKFFGEVEWDRGMGTGGNVEWNYFEILMTSFVYQSVLFSVLI